MLLHPQTERPSPPHWNRKKQTPPYYLLHWHAATSVFPLPVGPPIQYPLHPLSNVPCANHRHTPCFHFWRAIFFCLPMGIAMSCLHIGWILVQTVTSCSSSTFYPQFHGNLWHFQDVTSTFFTSATTIHLAVKFIHHHTCLSLVFPFHNQRESQYIYLGEWNSYIALVTLILCSKAPISSNTIRVKSFP